MFKKLLSYFYPITIYNKPSNISQTLEVTLYNGKTLLNTKNTNYSFGSLQTVLKKGLITIGKSEINKMENILVLGVAGGSVVQTLVTDFEFTKNIVGVELDAEIIEIANSYFNLDKIRNFKCVITDAEEFVKTDKNSDLDIKKESKKLPLELNSKIFIKDGERCYLIKLESICYIESQKNYVQIFFEGQKAFVKKSLNNFKDLEDVTKFWKLVQEWER